MANDREYTHDAFALRQEGKRVRHWLEIGKARQDEDGAVHIFLDRLPIGGFFGYVYLSPRGVAPPLPEAERPGAQNSENE